MLIITKNKLNTTFVWDENMILLKKLGKCWEMKILEYFKNQKEDSNFNLLPDGVFTIEQDGKIINVNDKVLEIFNTSKFNILGRYFSDFIEDGTAVLNKITQNVFSCIDRTEIPP